MEAIGAAVAVILAVGVLLWLQRRGRPSTPEAAEDEIRLNGPPCPAVLRLLADTTEFVAPLAAGAVIDEGAQRLVERIGSMLGGTVDAHVADGRLTVRASQRLEGELQLKFVAFCYSLLSRLADRQ